MSGFTLGLVCASLVRGTLRFTCRKLGIVMVLRYHFYRAFYLFQDVYLN